MALNSSGTLSVGGLTIGQSIELELGMTGTQTASLGDTNFRSLSGMYSGAISIGNFYGKAAFKITGVWTNAATIYANTNVNTFVNTSGSYLTSHGTCECCQCVCTSYYTTGYLYTYYYTNYVIPSYSSRFYTSRNTLGYTYWATYCCPGYCPCTSVSATILTSVLTSRWTEWTTTTW
jgi:hypothetical protein